MLHNRAIGIISFFGQCFVCSPDRVVQSGESSYMIIRLNVSLFKVFVKAKQSLITCALWGVFKV